MHDPSPLSDDERIEQIVKRVLDRLPAKLHALALIGTLPLRVAYGYVQGSDGAALAGAGYTSSRTAVGLYTITFDPAFSDIPAATVSVAQASNAVIRVNGAPTASSIPVAAITLAAVAVDENFNFIAVGPR